MKKQKKEKSHLRTYIIHAKKENSNLLGLADYIFNQVKLQQEVRDRWFGHYLAMVGGVVAFGTLTLKLFENSVPINKLLYIVSGVFVLAGILGILFFILYLCQRSNYRRHYKILEEIQFRLIEQNLPGTYKEYYSKKRPFIHRKHGADFYTLLIQNILATACICSSVILFLLGLSASFKIIIFTTIIVAIASIVIMQLLYSIFERSN